MTVLTDFLDRALVAERKGTYELDGNRLVVSITSGDHIGAKRIFNTQSPLLLKNIEELEIYATPEEKKAMDFNATKMDVVSKPKEPVKVVLAVTDSKGTEFDPDIHAVDEDGEPVLTKFKTFKKK